ncbi:MAG: protein kinase, partial [Candidatus Eisenbacteria bacterium]|nr:protein kinase [Candidatus Eisenbacteria bacterium]
MDRERFRRIRELFLAALELGADARATLLKEACGGDEDLRTDVERLLHIEEAAGDFLEPPALSLISPGDAASRFVGTRIGRYLIRQVVSSGGMGIVFEALQERPRRTVALKVLRQGMISPAASRRFEYEAQILARLRHPNIAQVIEAGTHVEGGLPGASEEAAGPVEGLPYLVMEYVSGARAITDYARRKDLSVRERLELFNQVCEAVHHGHRQGVIHRDLKPSNILVDAEGTVKIIDFGVARAAGSDFTPAATGTEAHPLVGTLQYMSPEQCAGDPLEVDTRSDVYALGVVLYELLCDELPYDLQEAAVFEALRLIREGPLRRPSAVKRALRGDMETILLTALEKERERRYQSVAELSDDIRRHLRGEVILARPAGPLRRIWKWVRRNPIVSVAAGLAVLATGAFLAYLLFWSFPTVKAQRDKVAAAYEEVVRLSDIVRVGNLEAEAEALWPAFPDKIPELEAWIEQARELAERLPAHRRTLRRLQAQALPGRPVARKRDDSSQFRDMETAWQYETQRDLVDRLEALADSDGGLLQSVRERLAFASTVRQRSLIDHRAEWDEAIVSIADENQCPFHKGLKIKPQLGLVPIGRDPGTGFWEFAHLQTGEIPERDAGGRIIPTEEMGLVFVLLPGGSYDMGARSASPEHPLGSPNVIPGEVRAVLPVHRVSVKPFLLSKYEMTQGQWLRFTGENPSQHGPWAVLRGRRHTLRHPVESVNWRDCHRVMTQLGLRLPSESEWEYAIRGGTTTMWYTGDDLEPLFGSFNVNDISALQGRDLPEDFQRTWDDGYAAHAPVGTF